MTIYFTDKSFKFLRALARNNDREWFHAHKADYDSHVRAPFQALLTDLQPDVLAISPHYRSEPKTVGGSLFRIQRDTRFSNSKAPYKSWQGARIFHERRKQLPAPSFYIHLQHDQCFVGAGLWHPETPTQRKVRQFIVDNPGSWKAAAHAPAFRRRFEMDDSEMLVRAPAGVDKEFAFLDDLRRKNFVAVRTIDDDVMCGPRLRQTLVKDLQGLAPFVDYLCAAVDLEF